MLIGNGLTRFLRFQWLSLEIGKFWMPIWNDFDWIYHEFCGSTDSNSIGRPLYRKSYGVWILITSGQTLFDARAYEYTLEVRDVLKLLETLVSTFFGRDFRLL